MEKPIDRISQAYFNEFGYEFGQKTRERIHWLCKQASGEEILDVGCSQGINSILLGREAKRVTGIDILEESITYAKEALSKENNATQDCVTFINDNFLTYPFDVKSYDSIIMGEVLEQISEPTRFINKAYNLLKDGGRLVITVPFGINDNIDNKNTFYIAEVIELIKEKFKVVDITYLGEWVGIITEKAEKHNEMFIYDKSFLFNLEQAFYQIERDLINRVNKLSLENKNNEKAIANLKQENDALKKIEDDFEFLLKENKKIKKQSLLKTDSELQILKEHKLLLDKYNELQKNNQKMEKEIESITQRYTALSNSKFGNLTLKYWEWKRR